MAIGTIFGTTGNEYIDCKIEWLATPNTSANTSKVTAKLYYKRNNTGFATTGSGTFTISIGGNKTTVTKYLSITEDAWVMAVEATETITHLSDGTMLLAISASGSIPSTSLTSTTCSQKVALDTIPRASTITSATNRTLGNACAVKWTPLAKTFRYKLKFTLGDWSYTTGAIHPNITTAYTYTGYTLPLTVANQLPKAKTGTMTVTLYTYSNSGATAQVGSASSKTFTVTVPDNTETKPSVSMTLKAVNSLPTPFSSLYIQGLTKVGATFTGSGKYSASISSYSLSALGMTDSTSPYESGYLTTTGTVTVTGTAKDSRGYTNTDEQKITVIPYSKPKILPASAESEIICARCDSEGNLSKSGTYLKIKAKRSYSKVMSGGTQKNFCLLRYRYKKSSATSFGSWTSLLAKTTTTTDHVDVTLGNIVSSTTTSYMVEVGVIDDVGGETGSASVVFSISTDMVTFHLKEDGKGAAFGKYAETDNRLEIADDWDVTGRVYSLGKGKANILSGDDFNNYKNFGVYDITSNTHAENIANCPYPKAGRLIVSSGTGDGKQSGSWAYILQEYISFDGKYKYYRLMYTGATADEWIYNKWECRSDKWWVNLGLSSAVEVSNSNFGRFTNGTCCYRVVNENHVYVAFNCTFTYSGESITVNASQIPSPYKPARNVYALCPVTNRGIARILVNPSGEIRVDWVQNIASAEATESYTVNWIDGYIDYWV